MRSLAQRKKEEAAARDREREAVRREAKELSTEELDQRLEAVMKQGNLRHAAAWFPIFVAERTRRHWA